MTTAPPTPCPECGAPPAAPFPRDTAMRRARRVAIAVVALLALAHLTIAALSPSTTLFSPFPHTRTLRPTVSLSPDTLRGIVDGTESPALLSSAIAAHRHKVPAVSSDILALEISRQRGTSDILTRDNLGLPLPVFQRIRDPIYAGRAAVHLWFQWDAAAILLAGSLFRLNYAPLALIAIAWLTADAACRALTRRRFPRILILLGALAILLAPARTIEHRYSATIVLPPLNAPGNLPHQVRWPYPRTEADLRALAAEVTQVIDRAGTTDLDADVVFKPAVHDVTSTHTLYAHPFPILQHTTLTSTTPFPPHSIAARLSWRTFDLQLPNNATATTRHILSLDIPALAQLALLFILLYHAIRLIHFHIAKRRHHKRLTKNLCPLCAYPAPKPV